MNLGTQTGSVIDHLQSRAVIGQPEPKPGMGCTILKWSDRDAATIFRVFQVGKATIIETRDDYVFAIAGSSHDGSAEYEHKVNVKGHARHFRRKRLEGELAKAVKAMDFDRAKVIKGILWPEPEPLFHIIKQGAYFRPNYSGYTDNPVDAGKYTKDELRPYADGIKRGDLQAVPV